MKLIIDISDKDYEKLKDGHIPFSILDIIQNGTPIPKATNGDIINKMFDAETAADIQINSTEYWWNSPYQQGGAVK